MLFGDVLLYAFRDDESFHGSRPFGSVYTDDRDVKSFAQLPCVNHFLRVIDVDRRSSESVCGDVYTRNQAAAR